MTFRPVASVLAAAVMIAVVSAFGVSEAVACSIDDSRPVLSDTFECVHEIDTQYWPECFEVEPIANRQGDEHCRFSTILFNGCEQDVGLEFFCDPAHSCVDDRPLPAGDSMEIDLNELPTTVVMTLVVETSEEEFDADGDPAVSFLRSSSGSVEYGESSGDYGCGPFGCSATPSSVPASWWLLLVPLAVVVLRRRSPRSESL